MDEVVRSYANKINLRSYVGCLKTFQCCSTIAAGLALLSRVMPLMMTSLVRNDGDERQSFVRSASWVRRFDDDKWFEY
jgi:hypothetical protein